jgi:hypothetical protein
LKIDGTRDIYYTAARGGTHQIIVKHYGGIATCFFISLLNFLSLETLKAFEIPILEPDVTKVEVEIMCLGEGLVAGVVEKKMHFDINFIGSDGSVVEKSRIQVEIFDPKGTALNHVVRRGRERERERICFDSSSFMFCRPFLWRMTSFLSHTHHSHPDSTGTHRSFSWDILSYLFVFSSSLSSSHFSLLMSP